MLQDQVLPLLLRDLPGTTVCHDWRLTGMYVRCDIDRQGRSVESQYALALTIICLNLIVTTKPNCFF